MFVAICPPYLLDGHRDQIRHDENNAKDGAEVTCPRPASCIWCGALIDLLTTKEAAALAGTVRDGICL